MLTEDQFIKTLGTNIDGWDKKDLYNLLKNSSMQAVRFYYI